MGHDGGHQGASSRESDWDADALQEWVAHVADAEEVSEGEILDRMLSALWILDEVESLMDESEGSGIPDLDLDGIVPEASPDTDAGSEADATSATPSGWGDRDVPDLDPAALLSAVDAIRDDADSASSTETNPGMARLDARLDAVVDDLAALTTRVDHLHDTDRRVRAFDTAAADGSEVDASEPTGPEPDLASTVDDLTAAIDDIAEQVDTNADSLADHSGRLAQSPHPVVRPRRRLRLLRTRRTTSARRRSIRTSRTSTPPSGSSSTGPTTSPTRSTSSRRRWRRNDGSAVAAPTNADGSRTSGTTSRPTA